MKRLLFCLALALAALTPSLAHAQTVCTYADNGGTTRSCTGVQTVAPDNFSTVTNAGTLTVTTGGTSQQAFATNTARKWLLCQNPIAAVEPLYISFGTNAGTANGSIELAPGTSIVLTSPMFTGQVNVTATTSAHAFVCKQG